MRFWTRLRRNRAAVAASMFLVLVVTAAVLAPLLAPHDENLASRFQDVYLGPSAEYPLGTDHVGRDILSRLLFGARYALLAGTEAVAIALVIGVPLGMAIGYRRGWADRVIMRVVDAVASVPAIVLAMAIIAGIGPGLTTAMVAVGVVFSMIVTRLVRAEVLAAREELYVDGALGAGVSPTRVLGRHILPNIAPTLIVQTTLLFAQAILAEAALSFLGIGANSNQASWGRMLRDAQIGIDRTIWPAIPPGVVLFATVVACNMLGDGLRDAFAREARGGRLGTGSVRRISPDRTIVPGEYADTAQNASPGAPAPVLSVSGLSVEFPALDGAPGDEIPIVDSVDLDIAPGQVLALVGESGSGKSLTALSLLGLVPDPGRAVAYSIRLDGRELAGMPIDELRRVRGSSIGVVFQEPMSALDPSMTVGRQVAEVLRIQGVPRAATRRRVVELFDDVGIPDPASRVDDYPHQFSGGMAQRVMVAMALASDPLLLIADEPTTALDVTVQGQLLDLFSDLVEQRDLAILLITHDLGVVADLADSLAVMYAGQIVETGALDAVLAAPQHPYTAGLIRAVPRNLPRTGTLDTIVGTVGSPREWPEHCRFAARCDHVEPRCRIGRIEMHRGPVGTSRCVRAGELALVGVLAVDAPRRATVIPAESRAATASVMESSR